MRKVLIFLLIGALLLGACVVAADVSEEVGSMEVDFSGGGTYGGGSSPCGGGSGAGSGGAPG
jgi:hypothetical protein